MSKIKGVIKSARPYTNKKTNAEMVVFNIEGNETPIHLSQKQVKSGAEINGNYSSLIGATLTVDFFMKGEKMLNDAECTKDDTIIKTFEFEQSKLLVATGAAAAKGASISVAGLV